MRSEYLTVHGRMRTAEGRTMSPCAECGMPVAGDAYHPYAACLMFKQCHNSETVKASLMAVVAFAQKERDPA